MMFKFSTILLFILAVIIRGGSFPNSGQIPVITSAVFVAAAPASTGQTFATPTVTNSPSGCVINSGNSSGDFTISSSCVITVTSQGQTDISGGTFEYDYTLNITASNGAGSSSPTNITLHVYSDGSVNAPTCTAQFSTLLNSYGHRPPWKVAGVDYCVGIPTAVTLSDPVPSGTSGGALAAGLTSAGCGSNASSFQITCSGTSCNISGWDFSLHGGYTLIISSCAGVTVQNNKFAQTAGNQKAPLLIQTTSSNATVQYNTIDGGGENSGTVTNTTTIVSVFSSGTSTIQYNYISNSWAVLIFIAPPSSVIVRFNIIQNAGWGAVSAVQHGDLLAGTSGANFAQFDNVYNLIYQSAPLTSALTQGLGNYLAGDTGTYTTFNQSYNTAIVNSGSNVDYIYNWDPTWVQNAPNLVQNYIDPSGTVTAWFLWDTTKSDGPYTAPTPVVTGNLNMNNGNTCTAPPSVANCP
jgi:hypothetical protein